MIPAQRVVHKILQIGKRTDRIDCALNHNRFRRGKWKNGSIRSRDLRFTGQTASSFLPSPIPDCITDRERFDSFQRSLSGESGGLGATEVRRSLGLAGFPSLIFIGTRDVSVGFLDDLLWEIRNNGKLGCRDLNECSR